MIETRCTGCLVSEMLSCFLAGTSLQKVMQRSLSRCCSKLGIPLSDNLIVLAEGGRAGIAMLVTGLKQ